MSPSVPDGKVLNILAVTFGGTQRIGFRNDALLDTLVHIDIGLTESSLRLSACDTVLHSGGK